MLAQIIPLLSRMSYAELMDFIDYAEFHHLANYLPPGAEKLLFRKTIKGRRAGLSKSEKTGMGGGLPWIDGMGEIETRNLGDLDLATDTQNEAYALLVELKKADVFLLLGNAANVRSTGGAIAWALLREKAPVRRLSEGNIQVKWIEIYKTVVKDEQGNEVAKSVKAPYLYFRYWTVQGDSDRKTSRHKSLYIGPEEKTKSRKKGGYPYRQLAELFDNLIAEHGIPKQWTNPTTGKTTTNKVRPKGDDNPIAKLERMIKRYIKVVGDGLEINHNRLERLQELLCGDELV